MNRWTWLVVTMMVATMAFAKNTPDSEKTGGTAFMGYEGEQDWPTAKSAHVMREYSVPVYIGLPDKRFKVIGRIINDREGIEAVGKELGGFFEGEKKRLRNIANQARQNEAEAVVITDDAEVLKTLGVSEKELKKTSPLTKDRKRAVLAVKFR